MVAGYQGRKTCLIRVSGLELNRGTGLEPPAGAPASLTPPGAQNLPVGESQGYYFKSQKLSNVSLTFEAHARCGADVVRLRSEARSRGERHAIATSLLRKKTGQERRRKNVCACAERGKMATGTHEKYLNGCTRNETKFRFEGSKRYDYTHTYIYTHTHTHTSARARTQTHISEAVWGSKNRLSFSQPKQNSVCAPKTLEKTLNCAS